ncbi:hypothetical protein MGG_14685 [Pyricularia oryzae 70-15]|uniref:Uncharacterized protein n=2 Tax=Pyricularia oryzae TaxID=318829 RepID=G4NCB0_PYRO7|nr:uncharacterized protein MGG_14685 [Pyricularia oryzae 70-15]EHA49059.1 hypothetical protein MGG_14685 [Pyricularia oryzae 70-15]ELQ42603.1 hypothetical protein OOU_Y34scaffold00203g92 [Pyricularia oryzae Y34]
MQPLSSQPVPRFLEGLQTRAAGLWSGPCDAHAATRQPCDCARGWRAGRRPGHQLRGVGRAESGKGLSGFGGSQDMRGLGFDGGFDEGCGKSKIVDLGVDSFTHVLLHLLGQDSSRKCLGAAGTRLLQCTPFAGIAGQRQQRQQQQSDPTTMASILCFAAVCLPFAGASVASIYSHTLGMV